MSATRQKELLETYDELGVGDKIARQEAEDGTRKEETLAREVGEEESCPTVECADRSADPVAFSRLQLRP